MKASYRWLRELVPGLEVSPKELAEKLTRAGLEVEALIEFGAASRSALVARVEKKEPHPSRPKLQLVTVDVGGRAQRVVCGAPNVPEPGGLVVLAPLGTHLPAKNMTLEPRDIGGVTSEGMLCSEAELGLRQTGGDAGILLLPAGTSGRTLADAIPESADTVFEIGLTPNRPDGLGHVGLAREVAALFGLPFALRRPDLREHVDATLRTEDRVKITIEDLERCPRYGAALVAGVRVGPSPLGVAWRLEALGVRSISNVVDVTNLVMLELGHPIHGFDLARVRGGRIDVRRARAGEKLETLDGVTRALTEDDLVIADGEAAVALAGVMGGAGSELRDSTTDVLVECAYFTPRGVRRAARRHGMHTESSHRFERGVDPGDVDAVLARAAELLVTLAGGAVAATMPITGTPLAPESPVRLRKARMDDLLGVSIGMDEATSILTRLGCTVVASDPAALTVVPPTHRPDMRIEEDLIEEVVRVHGIDRVPSVLPAIRPQPPRTDDALASAVKRAAIEVGLSESLTFAFVSRSELAQLRAPDPIMVLENPLSEERSVMRTSLLPGLVEATKRARRHGVSDVRLFSIGARFLPTRADVRGDDAKLPHEAKSFAAILAGHRDGVLTKPTPLDVFDAKGVAVEIVSRVMRRPVEVEVQPAASRSAHLHPRGAANLVVEGTIVGVFGPLHPEVERALDLGGEAFVIELDLEVLERIGPSTPRFKPIPVLPASTRDLSVVVHDDVLAGTVASAIREVAAELCESVAVFDLFRGGAVPKDHRSLAFHVVYRDPKAATDPANARTLTDAEVDAKHALVVKTVGERFGAVLRA